MTVKEQDTDGPEDLTFEEEWELQWGSKEEDDKPSEDENEELDDEQDYTAKEPEAGEAAPAVTPDAADPFSWISGLPDEVKAQAEKLKHSALSDKGRVAAYNRELDTLRRELDAAKRSTRDPAVPASQTTSVSAAPELSEKFEQLKEDFPEFAEAVEELITLDRKRTETRINEALTPVAEMKARESRATFERAVSEGAEKIFRTPETGWKWQDIVVSEDFSAWLSFQPKSVREAASLPDADEALAILYRYEQDYTAASAASAAGSPPLKADEVRKSRNLKKASSVVPGSRPVAMDPKNAPGDYEAEFNKRWG